MFWKLTPRLLLRICEAARRRAINAHNENVWLAWNTAALTGRKRMPPIKSLMIKHPQRRPQSWREQMNVCRMLAASYGAVSNG